MSVPKRVDNTLQVPAQEYNYKINSMSSLHRRVTCVVGSCSAYMKGYKHLGSDRSAIKSGNHISNILCLSSLSDIYIFSHCLGPVTRELDLWMNSSQVLKVMDATNTPLHRTHGSTLLILVIQDLCANDGE